MTKADLVETTFEKVGYSKKDVAEVVEEIFNTIKNTLESGEMVKISRFGNLSVRHKKERRGRNPQSGEEIMIGERQVMSFKASPLLKKAINSGS